MRVLGFNHYNLRAPRVLLEELRTFYCEVVGLAVGPRPPFQSFGYWLYVGEQDILQLSESAAGEKNPSTPATTFNHAAFSYNRRMKFTWDLRKAQINLRKHRVPFSEATTVFGDSLAATIPDPDHSIAESRFLTTGVSSFRRLLVVSYVEEDDATHLISAREATAHERKQYEN